MNKNLNWNWVGLINGGKSLRKGLCHLFTKNKINTSLFLYTIQSNFLHLVKKVAFEL